MSDDAPNLERTLEMAAARVALEQGMGADVYHHESLAQTKAEQMAELLGECMQCTGCRLRERAKNVVFADGTPDTDLMFVGEGPGQQEDEQGIPFVGPAGQLLTKIIEAIDRSREDVYLATVVKHCLPRNRSPEPDEVAACKPFLMRQIEIVQPKVIVTLGKIASQTLLESADGISQMRGRFHDFMGAMVMPTFHPSHLLRNESAKRSAWDDMKKVRDALK